MPRPGRIGFDAAVIAVLSTLGVAFPSAAQKCPPLPEGTTCTQFHYHVLMWNPRERTYQEIAGRHRFVSLEACEKAKSEAAKENGSLAEFIKTSVESSFQPAQFRECHCDRTTDRTSGVFLDTSARIAQMRMEDDAAWWIRERLLSSNAPRTGEFLGLLFEQQVRADRFLRKPLPSRLPESSTPPATAVLLDTRIGGATSAPPIAANLAFIDIPLPGSTTAPATGGPSSVKTAEPSAAFFTYELARADAILTASEKISEDNLKSAVHRELARRKRVLANLRTIANACPSNGPTARALSVANDEPARLTVIRGLFGDVVVRAWAPTDARGAAATTAIPEDAKTAVVFDPGADVDVRRAALYAALGQDRQFSVAETQTFANVIEELVTK